MLSEPMERLERTVFVGGLSVRTTRDSLLAYLADFGDVESLELPKDNKLEIKGFAKVVMFRRAAAEQLLAQKFHWLDGMQPGIFKWRSKGEYVGSKREESSRKVYVRFPETSDEAALTRYLEQFGEIERLDFKKDRHTNVCRNFLYITYRQFSAAQRLIQSETPFEDTPLVREMCRCKYKGPEANSRRNFIHAESGRLAAPASLILEANMPSKNTHDDSQEQRAHISSLATAQLSLNSKIKSNSKCQEIISLARHNATSLLTTATFEPQSPMLFSASIGTAKLIRESLGLKNQRTVGGMTYPQLDESCKPTSSRYHKQARTQLPVVDDRPNIQFRIRVSKNIPV